MISYPKKKNHQEQAVQEMFTDFGRCSTIPPNANPPSPTQSPWEGQSYPGPLSLVITYEVSILIMVSTQHFRLVCHVMNPLLITYPGISVTA